MSNINPWANGHGISPKVAICLGLGVMVLLAGLHPLSARARKAMGDGGICNISARKAARKTGVPLSVLMAISLAETGRKTAGKLQPWPWTVNMEGAGNWFDSRTTALSYAVKNYKRGARSFDIGCFQINYKWHGDAFSSIDQMFDPDVNALYAARYLLDLFQEKGDWKSAAGAYHSRTLKYAQRYADRFARLHSELTGSGAFPDGAKKARTNRYPLLQALATSAASRGSLVRIASGQGGGALIGPPAGRLY